MSYEKLLIVALLFSAPAVLFAESGDQCSAFANDPSFASMKAGWNEGLPTLGQAPLCQTKIVGARRVYRLLMVLPLEETLTISEVAIWPTVGGEARQMRVTWDETTNEYVVHSGPVKSLSESEVMSLLGHIDASRIWDIHFGGEGIQDGILVYFERVDSEGCECNYLVSPDSRGISRLLTYMQALNKLEE